MYYQAYTASKSLYDYSFYTLLMAAMRRADTENTEKLKSLFPDVYEELRRRYKNPGGCLDVAEFERIHRPDFDVTGLQFE